MKKVEPYQGHAVHHGGRCVSAFASKGEEKVTPLPLPKSIRVQSSAPRGNIWERLSPDEKMLVSHLTQAADAGRDLLFYQTHRHSLKIKRLLEEALSAEHLQDPKPC